MLRLLDGALLCTRCCMRRGVYPRTRTMSVSQRAEQRISKLRAQLESPTSLRLKPGLWGKMERRKRLEAALKRAEYIVAQKGVRKAKAETIEDIYDGQPPKRPWPRSKPEPEPEHG